MWRSLLFSPRIATVDGAVLEMRNEKNGVVATWAYDGLSEWQEASVTVGTNENGKAVMRLRINYNTEGESPTQVFVDQMTWTPAETEPQRGDPVPISSATAEGGMFKLTIPTASGKSYGVWTNANLLIDSWGLMGEPQKATGDSLKFEWTILPELPQLFFRAHEVEYR